MYTVFLMVHVVFLMVFLIFPMVYLVFVIMFLVSVIMLLEFVILKLIFGMLPFTAQLCALYYSLTTWLAEYDRCCDKNDDHDVIIDANDKNENYHKKNLRHRDGRLQTSIWTCCWL